MTSDVDSAANAGFEFPMDMLWDSHHYIELKVDSLEETLKVIPTTRQNALVLPHFDCGFACWSFYTHMWTPDQNTPIGGENAAEIDYEFFHYTMNRVEKCDLKGQYYPVRACFANTTDSQCGEDLVAFGIKKSDPLWWPLADGYMGLGAGSGYDNTHETSFLNQMHKNGMIDEKIFGIHTRMTNSTEDPTTIRFGGYNEEQFKEGHD